MNSVYKRNKLFLVNIKKIIRYVTIIGGTQ